MNQTYELATPLIKPLQIPQVTTQIKLSPSRKSEEQEEKGFQAQSLRILGSSHASGFNVRRNSAFSIYDPNQEQIVSQKCSDEGNSSQPSSEQHENLKQPKRTWKREKKDKRQMNRLETKNLNRYFRSKINEMLRDIKENSKDQIELQKAGRVLQMLNESNKIMFSQIRQIIKDQWLQQKFKSCTGILLKYIHGGKMGMQSKLIMLKYFNKILRAINKPNNFTCWK